MTYRFTVHLEEGPTSWGAWVDELPIFAVGKDRAEVAFLVCRSLELHIRSLQEKDKNEANVPVGNG